MQAALEKALVLGQAGHGEVDPVDSRLDVEELVMLRFGLDRLPEIASRLTHEQRLVIACQVGLQMDHAEFCKRFGWSMARYRTEAKQARKRLRACLEAEAAWPWVATELAAEGRDARA